MESMRRVTARNLLFTIHLYRIVIAKDMYRKRVNGDMAGPTTHQVKHGQITLTLPNQRTLSQGARTGGYHSRPPIAHIPYVPGQDQEGPCRLILKKPF